MESQRIIKAINDILSLSKRADFSNIEIVLANLIFMQQVIAASEGLMQAAIDQTSGKYAEYLSDHLNEEEGHEEWLANDLATSNIDVHKMPRIPAAAEMAGAVYYAINHISPYALLGYMAVLEGFPISMKVVEQLESMHGKELLATLRYHCEHDLDHRKELFSFIDKNPDPAIYQMAIDTANRMNKFNESLCDGSLWAFINNSSSEFRRN